MCIACGRPDLNHGFGSDAASGTTASASITQPVASIGQLADYLVNGYWEDKGTVAHHWDSNTITYNFGNLSASEQTIAANALSLWHDVANITFVQTTGTADINFNHNGTMTASTGGSWFSNGQMVSATVDISTDWVNTYGTGYGSYSYQTYIHEIGHSLGLGHQGPYNGSASYGTGNIYANDTWQYSVMSYFAQSNFDGSSYRFVMTPQMADIFAITSIYGESTTTRTGDTVYGFHSNAGSMFNFSSYGTAPAMTLYDNGGCDTLDCSGYSQSEVIDLTPGAFCSVGGLVHNIAIYTNTIIENAVGGQGSDTIVGNAANNSFTGGGGNDSINGGDSTDIAIYSGVMSDYQLVHNADGSWTVSDLRSGHDGVDQLVNIEVLQFADQSLTIGTAPPPTPEPTNTAPTVTSAAPNVSLTEWADGSAAETANTPHVASGILTYADPDASDVHTASFSAQGTNYLGTFSLNTSAIDSGDQIGWSFSVSDDAVDYLKAGQTLTQLYDVMITDDHGGSVTQTIAITLVGADDAALPTNTAPTVTSGAPKVSLTEWADGSAAETANTPHDASGTLTYADPDAGDAHTASFSAQGTNYLGTFSLNTNAIDSGDQIGWSFSVSDSAINYLKAGQTLTQLYNVMIADDHGGSAMQTITITLVGTDDATKGKGAVSSGGGNGHKNANISLLDDSANAVTQLWHDNDLQVQDRHLGMLDSVVADGVVDRSLLPDALPYGAIVDLAHHDGFLLV